MAAIKGKMVNFSNFFSSLIKFGIVFSNNLTQVAENKIKLLNKV